LELNGVQNAAPVKYSFHKFSFKLLKQSGFWFTLWYATGKSEAINDRQCIERASEVRPGFSEWGLRVCVGPGKANVVPPHNEAWDSFLGQVLMKC